MLPTTFRPRPPIHCRPPRRVTPAPPAPPAAPLDVVDVGCDHGYDFNWVIYWQFSGPLPDPLTLADLAGLTVGSVGPAAIEDRGADWVMLLFHSDGGVGAEWLVTPAGAPRFVPGQSGVVHEI